MIGEVWFGRRLLMRSFLHSLQKRLAFAVDDDITISSMIGEVWFGQRLLVRSFLHSLQKRLAVAVSWRRYHDNVHDWRGLTPMKTFNAFFSPFFAENRYYMETWNHDRSLWRWAPWMSTDLCSSFLQNRRFQVRLGSHMSNVFKQEMTVPQGSILSVTLFALQINSIVKSLTWCWMLAICWRLSNLLPF